MANPQDPRKEANPQTVNDALMDRIVRHLLYLTRLSTHEANWVLEQLNRGLIPELTNLTAAGVNRLKELAGEANLITRAQAAELEALTGRLQAATVSFMSTMQSNLFGRLIEIAKQEVDFELRLFRKTIPIEWNFSQPSEDQLRNIINTQPIPFNKGGKALTIREWFDNLSDNTVELINGQIRQGLMEGESIDQIMRRIRGTRAQNFTDGVLQTTRNIAEGIARTGVIYSSNQATNEFYRENSDLIKGIKVVVTLDSRTCKTCMWYDTNNPYELEDHPTPPFHVRCRCCTVAVTRSFKELGIDLDEAPEGTRASMRGEVPASMTYNQWLRSQVNQGNMDVVEEALGKSRAKLFAEGNLSVTSFTDRRGRQLTLEEIKKRESDVYEQILG